MRKALAAADKPAENIFTDKLRSYLPALRELLPDAKHWQSEGLTADINNNLSERLQGTYRDRIKTLRGLDSLETGQRYLDGWQITYNLFRGHHSLRNQTPGYRTKVNPTTVQLETPEYEIFYHSHTCSQDGGLALQIIPEPVQRPLPSQLRQLRVVRQHGQGPQAGRDGHRPQPSIRRTEGNQGVAARPPSPVDTMAKRNTARTTTKRNAPETGASAQQHYPLGE